jgi:hypothetical protein
MSRAAGVIVSFSALAVTALAAPPVRAADPTTADCLSSSENSLALRNQHKLREARAALLICAAPSCPADIRAECTRRVGEVNVAIPTIVFEAKDAAGNDLSAVRVSMDGQLLIERLEGTALSIDPGLHGFMFETPGQSPVVKQLVIREGEKDRRELVAFGGAATANAGGSTAPASGAAPAGAPAGTATAAGPTTVVAAGATPDSGASSGGWSNRAKLGIGLGAAGAVGLVTGIVFGVVSNSRAADFNSAGCSTSAPNDGPAGCQSKRDSVSSARAVAVVGVVSGVVLGGVGAYLFFAAPKEVTSKVAFRAGPVTVNCLPSGDLGVSCGGRF